MKAILIKSEDSYILKDGLNHVLGIDDKKLKDRLECPYLLSKQNCDEIFGIVNVEELAQEVCDDTISSPYHCYIAGFNKNAELNKDKVFTLEDMMNCWNKALKFQEHKETLGEYIQSLQQPTEIEVEIEMRPASLVYKSNLVIEELDSEGCLILKKI